MFRPSMLVIFRLHIRNLSVGYTNMCGEFTVLWGGVRARSRFVLDKGSMDWGCFGDCVSLSTLFIIEFVTYLRLMRSSHLDLLW